VRRLELAHLLRSGCAIAGDNEVLVVGSQAILGAYDESALPEFVTLSREADIAFLHDPDRQKADEVEGAIGELSAFHDKYQVYAEGVHIDTAELPNGWLERLVTWNLQSSNPATPRFLEPHDLVVSKLVAGRDKDFAFAASLIDAELVDLGVLVERAGLLPASGARVTAWLWAYQRRRI